MTDRLTKWEGRDENGPRAVLAKDGRFPDIMQEALRKLARYEDEDNISYDEEEIHPNCTVQIWRDSSTGACSIGWWDNEEEYDD